MKQCLKITFSLDSKSNFLQDVVRKIAFKLQIEGTAHVLTDHIKIIACGSKENMDQFIDILHKGSHKIRPEDVEIEPFFKEKEYRGVFRVIE